MKRNLKIQNRKSHKSILRKKTKKIRKISRRKCKSPLRKRTIKTRRSRNFRKVQRGGAITSPTLSQKSSPKKNPLKGKKEGFMHNFRVPPQSKKATFGSLITNGTQSKGKGELYHESEAKAGMTEIHRMQSEMSGILSTTIDKIRGLIKSSANMWILRGSRVTGCVHKPTERNKTYTYVHEDSDYDLSYYGDAESYYWDTKLGEINPSEFRHISGYGSKLSQDSIILYDNMKLIFVKITSTKDGLRQLCREYQDRLEKMLREVAADLKLEFSIIYGNTFSEYRKGLPNIKYINDIILSPEE